MTHGVLTKRISRAEMMKVPPRRPKATIGCRHVQVLMMTMGFLCCYAVRVAMSVSIEAMTDAKSANINFEEFNWSDATKNIILSSFFWGYVITQIPGGMIAQHFGGHKIYAISVGMCGLVTLLIPTAAHYGGSNAVIALRVITGLCQGGVLPIQHTLLSKWVPFEERGRLSTFAYSGGWVGNVISLLSSGLLAGSGFGWPSAFYLWGGLSILWAITWWTFGVESPADHKSIPFDEKEYIEVSLGVTETCEPMSTPWYEIVTSVPVWALLIAQVAQTWGFWMLLTKIPNYLSSVLHFDIKENGLISSLPYLTAWLLSFPVSLVSDAAMKAGWMSTTQSRKLCNTIGCFIPAAALIALGFVDSSSPHLAVIILIVAVATNIAIYCGHHINHMDLSPNFAGALMGITNTVANVGGILAPIISGLIVKNSEDASQWRNVFVLTAAIYIVGNLAFVSFGTSAVQSWNEADSEKIKTLRIDEKSCNNVETSGKKCESIESNFR